MSAVTSRPSVAQRNDTGALRIAAARRPADGRDTEFIRGLFAESRDELLLLTPDTRDVSIDMQFRAQRRAWRLEYPHARPEILLVRDVRAGHLLVDHDAANVHLVDLAIRTGLRGLGIGADLVNAIVADADRTDRTVRLRVWGGNHGARRFFERCGFTVGGAVGGYHELFRAPVR